MKTMDPSLLVVNRAKWLLMGLVLAVVLLFPHQDATAGQAPVNLGSAGSFSRFWPAPRLPAPMAARLMEMSGCRQVLLLWLEFRP